MTKTVLLSTLVSTVVLFVWSGVTQNFPWGVPTVQVISTMSDASTDNSQPAKTIKLAPRSLTTEQFEKRDGRQNLYADNRPILFLDHLEADVVLQPAILFHERNRYSIPRRANAVASCFGT